MHLMRFATPSGDIVSVSVPDTKSVLALAHVLENSQLQFKVHCLHGPEGQLFFGAAGFSFWLAPEASFGPSTGIRLIP